MLPQPHETWPDGDGMPPSPQQDSAQPPARAAMFLWILGGLEVVIFSCFASSMAMAALMSDEQLAQLMADPPAGLTPQMAGPEFQSVMMPLAVLFLVLGVLPGITYIVLAFFVKQARQGAVNLALLIVITQIVVFGIMFLLNIAAGIMAASPLTITAAVLTQGSPLVLLVAVARWLLKTRNYAGEVIGQQSDPWSERDPW